MSERNITPGKKEGDGREGLKFELDPPSHPCLDEESGGATDADDVNSSFSASLTLPTGSPTENATAAGVTAETLLWPTPPAVPKPKNDFIDLVSFTAGASDEKLPAGRSATAPNNEGSVKIGVNDLMEELSNNRGGENDMMQRESIMMNIARRRNSEVKNNVSELGNVTPMAGLSSTVSASGLDGNSPLFAGEPCNQSASTLAAGLSSAVSASGLHGKSPLFVDEPSTQKVSALSNLSTPLFGLKDTTFDDVKPLQSKTTLDSVPYSDPEMNKMRENIEQIHDGVIGLGPFATAGAFDDTNTMDKIRSQAANTAQNNHELVNSHEFGEPSFVDEPPTRSVSTLSNLSTPLFGLEDTAHDNVRPIHPMTILESITNSDSEIDKQRGSIEQIHEEDIGPDPFATAHIFEDKNISGKARSQANASSGLVGGISEPTSPTPFNFAVFDDLILQKRDQKRTCPTQTPDEIEHTEEPISNLNTGAPANARTRDRESPQMNTAHLGASTLDMVGTTIINTGEDPNRRIFREHITSDHPSPPLQSAGIDIEQQQPDPSSNSNRHDTSYQRESTTSMPNITEAYAVDDEIFIATPAEPDVPWLKQRRTRIMLAFLAILATTLVGLGAAGILSRDPEGKTTEKLVRVKDTEAPSISSVPSMSQVPSLSPSTCAYTISTSLQTLDLINPDNVWDTEVAIYGKDLVVAAKVSPESAFESGSLYVMFYRLRDDNTWESIYHIIESGFYWSSTPLNVKMSEEAAVIGLISSRNSKPLYIYTKNSLGLWEKLSVDESPTLTGTSFPNSLDIDGGLVVATDTRTCSLCPDLPDEVHLFKKSRGGWNEIKIGYSGDIYRNDDDFFDDDYAKLNPLPHHIDDIQVSGNVIAVAGRFEIHLYKYDQDNDEFTILQEPLDGVNFGPLILSGHHLAYFADEVVQIYRRGIGEDGQFEFVHNLTSPYIDDPIIAPRDSFDFDSQYVGNDDFYEGEDWKCWDCYYPEWEVYNDTHMTLPYGGFGSTLAMDNDLLAVGSHGYTHIFSQQDKVTRELDTYINSNEEWKEVLRLEPYDSFQISGRSLIGTKQNKVHAMNVEDCTQHVPTQLPSTSPAPTTCYNVEIRFLMDEYYESGSSFAPDMRRFYWEATITPLESAETTYVVNSTFAQSSLGAQPEPITRAVWQGPADGYYFEDSLCLSPGRYQYAIQVNYAGASCLNLQYSLKSNEQVITQEIISEGTGDLNATVFDIPFERTEESSPTGRPLATKTPTLSPLPSTSPRPTRPYPTYSLATSQAPTLSPHPTTETRAPLTRNTPFPTEPSISTTSFPTEFTLQPSPTLDEPRKVLTSFPTYTPTEPPAPTSSPYPTAETHAPT